MPRVVKAPDVRRSEILAAAYALFVRHGYEATTVNMLIDALRLSKGAFYHHFASKEDVLHALAERMVHEMKGRFAPSLSDPSVAPLDKLRLVFGLGTQWKVEHAPMVRALASLYWGDQHLRLRARLMAESVRVVAPMFARILEEGKRDGSFTIGDPDETARLAIHLGIYLQDAFGEAWHLAATDLDGAVELIGRRAATYQDALERILGVAKGSLTVIDLDVMRLFLQREKS
jgi:AcrR family transcriptional regulator